MSDVPMRQVRAVFDEHTVTVYQAYGVDIAVAAVAAGRFVAPFKRERMTWIKPSFLWMMYRCGREVESSWFARALVVRRVGGPGLVARWRGERGPHAR